VPILIFIIFLSHESIYQRRVKKYHIKAPFFLIAVIHLLYQLLLSDQDFPHLFPKNPSPKASNKYHDVVFKKMNN
jgi:hypothetical protein